MSQVNNPIEIKNLDFPEIKKSLVTFLSNTTEFRNFNFEGSNISAMLDILAYNTYYMSMYMSMLFSETFIDSAVERSSLVSALKPVGYTPKSVSASKLLVDVEIEARVGDLSTQIIIPPYCVFNGGTYNFVNIDPFVLTRSGNSFTGSSMLLYQGEYKLYRFIVKNSDDYFVIPYKTIDTSTLKVRVFYNLDTYEAQVDNLDPVYDYTLATDLFDKTSDSQIFFIQEDAVTGNYSLYFGDGVIGKKLDAGNVIETTFLVSDGAAGNGVLGVGFYRTSANESSLSNYSSSEIQITTPSDDIRSFGGEDRHSIDFMRKYGPYHFEAQQRLVTENDYQYAIRSYLPDVQVCKVWGGEDNDPPRYATAMAMIKLKNQDNLYPTQKQLIINYIKSISVVGTDFTIVDPNIIYPLISLEIRINPRYISTLGYLETRFRTYISDYCQNSNSNEFRPSDLIYFLRTQEPLVSSINVSTKLKKNIYYTLNSNETKEISFDLPLIPNSLVSSKDFSLYSIFPTTFTEEFIDTNDTIYYKKVFTSTAIPTETVKFGTIDYTTGSILLDNLEIKSNSTDLNYFTLIVTPQDIDLFVKQHSLLILESQNITFTLNLDAFN